MLNKKIKAFKIINLMKAGLSVVFFTAIFFSFGATLSFAQFYPQTYPYGDIYTPAYTPIDYNNSPNNIYGNPANNTGYNYNNIYSGEPAAITQPATSVTNDSAQLNSLILNPSQDPNATTWFDYGTDLNLGRASTLVSVGSVPSVRHINSMTGLTSGTTYYFRAVLQNSYSKINGAILSFTTNGIKPSTIIYTPVIYSTYTASQSSTTVYNTPATTVQPYTTSTQPSLGANVYSSGSTLPINVFGWVIIIILIVILVLAIKRTLDKFSPKKENITF